jgi:integrase
MERQTAPGLRYHRNGYPIWRASKSALKKGYPVKLVNLSNLKDRPKDLVERCIRLQREMEEWLTGGPKPVVVFDGTFKGLLDLYETHEESSYRGIKGSSRESYDCYLALMQQEIGDVLIDNVDGNTLRRWFRAWSENGKHLAKAHLILKVLKAALVFAVTCRKPGCSELLEILKETMKKLPGLKRREAYITFRAVNELRKAVHQLGHPHAALAYALQFEADQRQRDIVGEWVKLDEPTPLTDIVKNNKMKWYGAHWKMVKNNTLEMTPSKTAKTTGKKVIVPLSEYPMVVEELKHPVHATRKGPMILHPKTGLPYRRDQWIELWHQACAVVGIDHKENWNRDLRASGLTEGDDADADIRDQAEQAGHATPLTTKRHYIRGHRAVVRLAEKRRAYRERQQRNNQ